MQDNSIALKVGANILFVANSLDSTFAQWLKNKLKEPTDITDGFVKAVMNNFDSGRDDSVVVFRGSLQTFLWDNKGASVSLN
jgi:hypothetical protein